MITFYDLKYTDLNCFILLHETRTKKCKLFWKLVVRIHFNLTKECPFKQSRPPEVQVATRVH